MRIPSLFRGGRLCLLNDLHPYLPRKAEKPIFQSARSTTSLSVSKVQKWIADNYPALKEDKNLAREIAAFEEACGDQEPHLYVARACRIAVAHASAKHPSDPDDFHELRRLHVAARVIRALARRFISSELAVSDCFFDGS